MDLEECDRCGEEYPANWQVCPYCSAGERPTFRMRDEDE